jgi:hypothetical protein
MIRAQMPDGTALLFPDDTPDIVIDGKVRDYIRAGDSTAAITMLSEQMTALRGEIREGVKQLVAAELTPRKLTRDWNGKADGVAVATKRGSA